MRSADCGATASTLRVAWRRRESPACWSAAVRSPMRHSRMNCAASAMSRCAGAGCRSTGWRRMQARSTMWATRCCDIGRACDVDLLHLNLPSQAASIPAGMPVVVASHSCIGTWWDAVRGDQVPADWQWQVTLTGRGLRRADVVIVPTQRHGMRIAPGLWAAAAGTRDRQCHDGRTRRQCRRTVRAGGGALVGRRQECCDARCRRRPRALACGHGGRARRPERRVRPAAARGGAGRTAARGDEWH